MSNTLSLDQIKPKLMAFLLCKDIQPNTAVPGILKSLSGIFDKVFAPGLPSKMDTFWVFLRFLGGKGEHNIRLMIHSPSGKPLKFQTDHGLDEYVPAKFLLPSLEALHDFSVCVRDMIVNEYGVYKIRVYLGENCIAEHPITVEKAK